MAQGPSDTILVAIRITLRIRESKVRNPDPPDYPGDLDFGLWTPLLNKLQTDLCHAMFGEGLCSLSASSSFYFICC